MKFKILKRNLIQILTKVIFLDFLNQFLLQEGNLTTHVGCLAWSLLLVFDAKHLC